MWDNVIIHYIHYSLHLALTSIQRMMRTQPPRCDNEYHHVSTLSPSTTSSPSSVWRFVCLFCPSLMYVKWFYPSFNQVVQDLKSATRGINFLQSGLVQFSETLRSSQLICWAVSKRFIWKDVIFNNLPNPALVFDNSRSSLWKCSVLCRNNVLPINLSNIPQ